MKKTEKGFAYIILIGVVIAALVVGLILYFVLTNKKDAGYAAISGTIDLNGQIPANASIAIVKKGLGEEGFQTVVENITAQDKIKWVWDQAQAGKQYQIQAFLRANGKDLVSSEIRSVAAPAANETLSLNIASPDNANSSSFLSGSFDINGYIPSGSVLSVVVRNVNSLCRTLDRERLSSFL